MKGLLILLLGFFYYPGFSQEDSFSKWGKKILTNESFGKMIASIESDSFKISLNKKDIPKPIIDTLRLWDKNFRLVNPNKRYYSTDFIKWPKLSSRQIILILIGNRNIFITYHHGQRGFHNHILWVDYENKKINDIWIGTSCDELNSIDRLKMILKMGQQYFQSNAVCF